MPSSLENFPLASITDGLTSYIQYLFGDPKHIPADYRWNSSDRESRITISGPFVIDKERPMAAPFIVVERSGFQFENRTIDNLKSAKENVFMSDEKVLIADGGVSITVGSGAASEASSIANYLAVQIQADRHGIISTLGFVRNLNVQSISPETPVFKDSEVKRWEVVLNISVSLQMGWMDYRVDPVVWEELSIRAVDSEKYYASDSGIVMTGSDLLTDPSANFGFELTNNPQLLTREMNMGWYYIQFDGDASIYNIEEVTSPTSLKLSFHDSEGNKIPFNPDESKVNSKYKLVWNSVHLHVEIPTRK
jgi:hypothetical protein